MFIKANTAQISVLMLYNDAQRLSLRSISDKVKLPIDGLIPHLQPIIELRLLDMDGVEGAKFEPNATIPESTTIRLNIDFSK